MSIDISVTRKDLLRLVARASAVADKKNPDPRLANVLLDASADDHVVVSATDMFLAVSGKIAADVRARGSVAVPAKDLLERTKAMPDGPLRITATKNTVLFKAEGSKLQYRLPSMPGSEVPPLPVPRPDAIRLALPADILSLLIARTQFSISGDDTRPNLHSAFFEWEGDRVRMVTTDGHRLTLMEVTVPDSHATAAMLLPLKAIVEIRRLTEEARTEVGKEATITIIPSEPSAFFEVPGATLAVKLVAAQFPSYKQVIPQAMPHVARMPRARLASALRAVSLAANDKVGGVRLAFTADALRLSSESPESGEGLDEIPIEYTGPDLVMGFNAKYLLDVLGAIDDDDAVALDLGRELDPVVLRPALDRADRLYKAVVMPLRLT